MLLSKSDIPEMRQSNGKAMTEGLVTSMYPDLPVLIAPVILVRDIMRLKLDDGPVRERGIETNNQGTGL